MASLTQWTRVWASSGSWWWTGRPGTLQSTGLQRVGHNWATELNYLTKQLEGFRKKQLFYFRMLRLNLPSYTFQHTFKEEGHICSKVRQAMTVRSVTEGTDTERARQSTMLSTVPFPFPPLTSMRLASQRLATLWGSFDIKCLNFRGSFSQEIAEKRLLQLAGV